LPANGPAPDHGFAGYQRSVGANRFDLKLLILERVSKYFCISAENTIKSVLKTRLQVRFSGKI